MRSGPVVPIIDIAALGGDDRSAHEAVVAAIGAACRDVGFFGVTGHGVDPDVLDAVFDAAHEFFALESTFKQSVAMDHDGPGAERGYDGLALQRLDNDAPPDAKESFNAGPHIPDDHPLARAGTPMHGPNRWPDPARLPDFRADVERAQAELGAVARNLLRAMAESLGIGADYFDEFQTTPLGAIRLTHYPAPGGGVTEPGGFGAGAHTDWGALTVLAQDDAGGLEVRADDGTWIPVPPTPGALVVNIGDLVERWTNGTFRSTPHRVQQPTRDRYSIVLFHDLDWYAPVECLVTCTGPERPPAYPPTTVGEHLLTKFRASVVSDGWERSRPGPTEPAHS